MGINWDQAGHIADALAVPGFALGALGFYLTWRQASKARTAAEAARDAASHTETAIGRSALFAAIPEIQAAESVLTDAVAANDTQLAREGCTQWRASAGRVRGLLEVADLGDPALLSKIQRSMTLAVRVRNEVIKPACVDVPPPTNDLLTLAGMVADELHSLSSRESYRTGKGK